MLKRLLWIGSYQSPQGYKESLIDNMGETSAYASQKGIINGIDRILIGKGVMDSVNVVVNPPYPIYPKRHVKGYRWKRNENSQDVCVGYVNLKYVNYFFRDVQIACAVKRWGKSLDENDEAAVLIYAASVGKLRGALYLKRKYQAKVFIILPDIPEFVNAEAPKPVLLAKRVAAKKLRKYFKHVDGFILYSKYMADYYNIPSHKWMLMEGVFDPDEEKFITSIEKKNDGVIRLMYCGALDKRRSIPEILDMFKKLENTDDERYELWLIGAGNCEELIKERAEADSRIKYLGYIRERKKVLEVEKNADILLYTREIESEGAFYCFPSKLFEYLMTENPIACVRVPSIAEEFFSFMYPIEEVTAAGIYNSVQEILCDLRNHKNMGRAARNFIMNNKSSYVQGKRIIDFVYEER